MTEPVSFDTPVLFLIFNRPDTTDVVFQRIRTLKPKHLYVSADGPRQQKPGEARLCEDARDVIKTVDWNCELKTRFLEHNYGCKLAVSSAITWFFDNVSEGIILEDDCVPDVSFFHFATSLLDYYRNNTRIMHIGGTNFQDGMMRGPGSYYFSNLTHIWGWATWKRAWEKYDLSLIRYSQLLEENFPSRVFLHSRMAEFWKKRFDLAYHNKIDTWDIQWQYTLAVNNGLSAIPNANLVSNIGFHDEATHTLDDFNILANIPASAIQEIRHPTLVAPDHEADYYSFRRYFSPSKAKKLYYVLRRSGRFVRRRIFKH